MKGLGIDNNALHTIWLICYLTLQVFQRAEPFTVNSHKNTHIHTHTHTDSKSQDFFYLQVSSTNKALVVDNTLDTDFCLFKSKNKLNRITLNAL